MLRRDAMLYNDGLNFVLDETCGHRQCIQNAASPFYTKMVSAAPRTCTQVLKLEMSIGWTLAIEP